LTPVRKQLVVDASLAQSFLLPFASSSSLPESSSAASSASNCAASSRAIAASRSMASRRASGDACRGATAYDGCDGGAPPPAPGSSHDVVLLAWLM